MVVVVVVIVVMVLVVVMMVVVVVVVDNKPLLTSSTLPSPQIPSPRTLIDKFFLSIPASLAPNNITTTIPPTPPISHHGTAYT